MYRSSYSNKKLPKPENFSLLVEFEIELLKEMVMSLELNLNEVRDSIKAEIEKASPEQYDSEYDYLSHMDSLNDEIVQLIEVADISKKLAVVGLYMIVENFTKRIMKCLYHDLDEKTRKKKLHYLYIWDVLKKELNNLCGLDLSEVSEYSVIDELRCLNNDIKHSGYVGEDLSAFLSWKDDIEKEIDVDKIELEKFYISIPKYIHDMVEKINDSFIRTE